MSLRLHTYAGVLELGRPAPGAPPCERCANRAQLELDVVTSYGPARVIELSARRRRELGVRRGEPQTRRVALCVQCVESLVGAEFLTGKHG